MQLLRVSESVLMHKAVPVSFKCLPHNGASSIHLLQSTRGTKITLRTWGMAGEGGGLYFFRFAFIWCMLPNSFMIELYFPFTIINPYWFQFCLDCVNITALKRWGLPWVQWLRLRTSTAEGVDSIPGWGAKMLQATRCSQKKKSVKLIF